MKNLLLRLKFAWCAFWLIPFEVKYKPYHITHKANGRYECDNNRRMNKCQNKTNVFLEETWIEFTVKDQHAYIVCNPCANEILSTGKVFRFPWEDKEDYHIN